MNIPLSVRIPEDLSKKLDLLCDATQRSKSFYTVQALQELIEREAWQVQEIMHAIKEADAGDFATDEEVEAVFNKWSRKNAD